MYLVALTYGFSIADSEADSGADSGISVASVTAKQRNAAASIKDWTIGFELELDRIRLPTTPENLLYRGLLSFKQGQYADHKSELDTEGMSARKWLTMKHKTFNVSLEGGGSGGNARCFGRWKPEVVSGILPLAPFATGESEFGREFRAWMRTKEWRAVEAKFQHMRYHFTIGLPLAAAGPLLMYWYKIPGCNSATTYGAPGCQRGAQARNLRTYKAFSDLDNVASKVIRDFAVDSKEYYSFLILAAHVIRCGTGTIVESQALYAKMYMQRLLIRTNYAEIYYYLTRNLDSTQRSQFMQLHVMKDLDSVVHLYKPFFTKGIHPYLGLLEYASQLGIEISAKEFDKYTDVEQLQLAKNMIKKYQNSPKEQKMQKEDYFARIPLYDVKMTPMDWLKHLTMRKDYLSDRDSPVAKHATSKVVFKSMGAHKMTPEGHVIVEFREDFNGLWQTPATGLLVKTRAIAKHVLASVEWWRERMGGNGEKPGLLHPQPRVSRRKMGTTMTMMELGGAD